MADNKMVFLEGMKVVAQQSKAYTDQKFSELQNRFDVLADEYCIYKNVEDSDGTTIEDSEGDTVIGKVVYAIR